MLERESMSVTNSIVASLIVKLKEIKFKRHMSRETDTQFKKRFTKLELKERVLICRRKFLNASKFLCSGAAFGTVTTSLAKHSLYR